MTLNSREVRQLFTRFFEERGHRRIPSSSLIPPPEEKTLIFANAGMNQMKPYFMGLARPPATRLTSIQKCFRTSDVEEVGDGSHCTFFEMLGNFSVGDYFKAEVIPWAFELLTAPQPQGMGLKADRIWATIFQDDEEAFELWRSAGLPPERIVRYGEKDNYWFMGAVGPCGPNTEINYDFGAGQGCGRPDCHPNCEQPMADGSPCNRFIELWNLVFMTLYQAEDGTRTPLPQRNVDTGAGLERWPMPLLWEAGVDWQGNPKQWTRPPTIYDSDLFRPILAAVGQSAGLEYDSATEMQRRAMRIVAEHTRAATFLIADGVTPANEGRGYVLRRLIRRAVYFGQTNFLTGLPFMEYVSRAVGMHFSSDHPQLIERAALISQTLADEERRFSDTIGRGRDAIRDLKELSDILKDWLKAVGERDEARYRIASRERPLSDLYYSSALRESNSAVPEPLKRAFLKPYESRLGAQWWLQDSATLLTESQRPALLSGETAFVLWDTYGFPPELAKEVARQYGLEVDLEDFEKLMAEQRQRSRAATRFEGDAARIQLYAELALPATEFLGYETTRTHAGVSAIVLDGATVLHKLSAESARGHRVELVLDRTPFYAEGGGQVGDRGEIVWPNGRFVVEDTQAVGDGGVIAHAGRLEAGSIALGAAVEARIDEDLRADTMRNHTATHLLHAALRQVLGTHVRQAGSLVSPDRLRFDFTHLEGLSPEELRRVQLLANEAVLDNIPVHIDQTSYEEAVANGALAFFGEKYANTVRVVEVCDPHADACFSKELCGGTHVHASGDIGSIVVTAETSIGAGLRRIEAVTGRAAAERIRGDEETLGRLSTALQAPPSELEARVAALKEENDRLRKQLQATERRLAFSQVSGGGARGQGTTEVFEPVMVPENFIADVPVAIQQLDVSSTDALRAAGDVLKSRLQSGIVVLASVIDGKPSFLAMVTPDLTKRVSAGDIVKAAAQAAGGGGGGRPEVAQGGGTDPSKVEAALAAARALIESKLGASSPP